MTTGTASQLQAGDNIASPVRVGEVVAGKYVVERTLGVGGMGVVVAARDRVLDRAVAIKFLLPKLAGTETAVQRFVREARAATRVTSEHVVRLLEIDKLPSGTPFFVMEYLQGSDLRALLRERGPLEASLAVDYVLQALQAVAEGHIKGIVHRDIKPGNLFLTARADGTPLIKVLDFGIAKTLESDAAESTALTSSDDVRLGSPAYMPPEQLQNPRDVDTRSDIWSLGATLYELLCGRPPFEGPGYLELATRILSSPPLPLSEREPVRALPRGLEQVIVRCLQKERRLRYANAAELAAALAPFGSEDARMSLTRVRGLWGSHSLSAVSTNLLNDANACATTLVAAGDSTSVLVGSTDKHSTQDIGPAVPRGSNRSWIVVAGACALVAIVLSLRGGGVKSTATPTPIVAPGAQPEAKAVFPVEPAMKPEPVAAPAPVFEKPDPSSLKPAVSSKPSQGSRAAVTAASIRRAASANSAGAQQSDVSPPDAPETTSSVPGRSEEIERLIKQRR